MKVVDNNILAVVWRHYDITFNCDMLTWLSIIRIFAFLIRRNMNKKLYWFSLRRGHVFLSYNIMILNLDFNIYIYAYVSGQIWDVIPMGKSRVFMYLRSGSSFRHFVVLHVFFYIKWGNLSLPIIILVLCSLFSNNLDFRIIIIYGFEIPAWYYRI